MNNKVKVVFSIIIVCFLFGGCRNTNKSQTINNIGINKEEEIQTSQNEAQFNFGQFAFVYDSYDGHVLLKDPEKKVPKDLTERLNLPERNTYFTNLAFLDNGKYLSFEEWDNDTYTIVDRYIFDIELNDFINFPSDKDIIGWNKETNRLILGERDKDCSTDDIMSFDIVERPDSDYIIYEFNPQTQELKIVDQIYIGGYIFNFATQNSNNIELQFQNCPTCNFECCLDKEIYLYETKEQYSYSCSFPENSINRIVKILVSPDNEKAIFIAYNIYEPITTGLFIGNKTATSYEEIYRDDGWLVRDAMWSENGKYIAVLMRRADVSDPTSKLMIVSADGLSVSFVEDDSPVLLGWFGDTYFVYQSGQRYVSMFSVNPDMESYINFDEIRSDEVVWSQKP